MGDLLKRIERLERMTVPERTRLRHIIRFIAPIDCKPGPWRPKWARSMDDPGAIYREADETPEAFEARALAHFPDFVMLGCGDA